MAPPRYTIFRLPQVSPHLPAFIEKFRATKLSALQADPAGLVSQYSAEAAHPPSIWSARFKRSAILICIPTPDISTSSEDALLASEWIGFVALRGPMAYSDYYLAPEAEQSIPNDWAAEMRWHIYDLYTSLTHRGKGVARLLIQACVDVVVETKPEKSLDSQMIERARIRLFCNPNAFLVGMYKRMGFEEAGRVTLKEGYISNGMEESIPKDTVSTKELRERWETRFGQVMERVVGVV